MGSQASALFESKPTWVVSLRLELLSEADSVPRRPTNFFARVYTAADDLAKYRAWGQPQAVGLWDDDVVTISIHTAYDEAHFDRQRFDDFAEVYLPWVLIKDEVLNAQGEQDAVFDLALQKGGPWLGQGAAHPQYFEAFKNARSVAEERRTPVLRIFVRLERAADESSAPGASAPAETPPERAAGEEEEVDEAELLARLRSRQQALVAKLQANGLSDGSLSGRGAIVEDEVRAHLESLSKAILDNRVIKAETISLDQQLAQASSQLSEEQRTSISAAVSRARSPAESAADVLQYSGGSFSLSRGLGEGGGGADGRTPEMRAAELMKEIQAATQANVELIASFSEKIKTLEAELVAAAATSATEQEELQPDSDRQLQAILAECDELGASIREVKQNPDFAKLRSLQDEQKAQLVHIDDLRRLVYAQSHSNGNGAAAVGPPGTGLLQEQAGQIQLQIVHCQKRNVQDQVAHEQFVSVLRQEIRQLEEDFGKTRQQHADCETEVGELLRSRSSAKDPERDRHELISAKENLAAELARCRRRLEFFEQKIEQLREEAEDIKSRAQLVWRKMPNTTGHLSDAGPGPGQPSDEEVTRLQETLQGLQLQVQDARQLEEALQEQHAEAKQAFEVAEVEAMVLEQRLRLLKNRLDPNAVVDPELAAATTAAASVNRTAAVERATAAAAAAGQEIP
eukprot:TRINITY_DN11063_c0_g1_i1.p1 TRINITY_DN11063_c0_g1~~TRINITY_DN11063_c0_g1_i1.p1  ORF type:complete len:686 (+),score=243.54 TRINITY_DN11063_c0_g1_i1:168-2225(+)